MAAAAAWWWWSRGRPADGPPNGIVLLLREPVALDAARLAAAVETATGKPPRVQGASPHFIVSLGRTLFTVYELAQPYGEEVEVKHRAWLAIDLLHRRAVNTGNYQIVARTLAELAGKNCVALYHPPLHCCVPFQGQATLEALRGEDPLRALFISG
jgi:hypothetical protein